MSPTPTGRAVTFARDELIVSKTDLQGRITYANDVFLRVSGYECAEVVGQPHNLIRHPETPRAVFALLWDEISTGAEVFAYINNLARNGDHYWVLAHVTATYDETGRIDGYHSSRRCPTPRAVEIAERFYRPILAEERRQSGGRAATEAGLTLMRRALADRGMEYDEFVWSVIDEGRTAA